MDASIILGGQQLDLIGAMDRGRSAAESQINLNRQNAMNALLRDQGAGIMAGDPNSLNALAAYDPQTALGIKSTVQSNTWAEEDRAAAKAEGKRMAEEALKANADKLTAEQLAAEQDAMAKGLAGAAGFVQRGDEQGYNAWLTQHGMDPAEFPMNNFVGNAAMIEGGIEAINETLKTMGAMAPPKPPNPTEGAPSGYMFTDPNNPAAGVTLIPGYVPKSSNGITQTVRNADGTETTIQIGGSGGAGSLGLTEAEGKATGFLYRMENSDKILGDLEAEGSSLWNKAAGSIPVLGNYMVGEGAQKFDQAKRDFLNAILRRESGAVISPEEFANAEKQYFPQPGDGPEVVKQKRENRRLAIEGVRASSGAGGSTTAPGSGSQPQGAVPDQAEIDQLMLGP